MAKTRTPGIDKLHELAVKLANLTDDPHPGLITWSCYLARLVQEIHQYALTDLDLAQADLLEACKATVANCCHCENGLVDICEYPGDFGHHEPCPCCSPARYAIAKAEKGT